ncbi:MAG: DUF1835 domain-containing protein [Chitinophagaceae bacterium]|nr:DUF1835 domain-containing protein [Chitinophagaceae bacterium]
MYIVFGEEDAKVLAASFDLDENMRSDIIVVDDDWSIGPLNEEEGEDGEKATRDEWIAKLYEKKAAAEESYTDRIRKILNDNPEEEAIMWIAPNSRDVCGYYYLVTALSDCKGRLYTIWLNNLPFINEKGMIFYPSFLSEIPAREFLKARKLATEVSLSTFETDPDEWKKLVAQNKPLRVLESHKRLLSKDENYFDKEILNLLQNDFQKASRLTASLKGKSNQYVNPRFILWRLRELINAGVIEARGDWPAQENFEVRKFQANPNPEAS